MDNLNLTRRGLLGSALAGALVLAGCGASGGSGTGTGTAAGVVTGSTLTSGPRKRGGTLKFSPSDFLEAKEVDPNFLVSSNAICTACFDPLIKLNTRNQLELALAEEFAPDNGDLSSWIIRVHEGVEFHDGKPLTADDVMFTIRRILNPKNPGAAADLMSAIDLPQMKKLDSRTVRLRLKYPNSQIQQGFAGSFGGIVPVGFDPQKPIGTGPFKQVSYTPAQSWIGTRNDNYWQNGKPYLEGLELLGFNSTAALSALLSGQIDGRDHMLSSQVTQLKQNPNLQLIVSDTGSIQQIGMNCRKGQMFEDPNFRKAIKLMTDRTQLVGEVYEGYGAVGNDVGAFPQFDASCSPSIPAAQYDPEQAKSLIKAAGKQGTTIPFRTAELVPGMTEAADVLIQQAQAVGITLKLDMVVNNELFYTDAYYTAQLQSDYTSTINMYSGAAYYWVSNMAYNSTGYSSPRVDALYKQAQRQTGHRYDELMGEMSQILHEEGPWLVWGRENVIDVCSKKFTGVQQDATGQGFGNDNFCAISLA